MFPKFVDKSFENKVLNISAEEYHSMTDAVHSSSLKKILISPNAYRRNLQNPMKPTKSTINGSIVHELALEGSKYLNRYHVEPPFKGFTKEGKETTSKNSEAYRKFSAEFKASLPPNSVILSQESYDELRWQLDAISEHKFAMDIIKNATPEHRKQWRCPVTGLWMVSSDDLISFENDLWADVKTCVEPDWDDGFRKAVESKVLNYPFQEAMYSEGNIQVHGKAPHDRYWIAIQNCDPYEVRVHYIDEGYRKAGRLQFERARRDLAVALKNDSWPQGQQVIESGEPSIFYQKKFPEIFNELGGSNG